MQLETGWKLVQCGLKVEFWEQDYAVSAKLQNKLGVEPKYCAVQHK